MGEPKRRPTRTSLPLACSIDKETASIVACHIRDVVSFNCHLFWERQVWEPLPARVAAARRCSPHAEQESKRNLATVARAARASKKQVLVSTEHRIPGWHGQADREVCRAGGADHGL